MGVSTTHRINLSMWILIYSFSDTYYVWAACVLTCLEATKSALLSVFTPTETVSRKIFWAYVTTAQDAICSLLFPIVLYAKCRLSRT